MSALLSRANPMLWRSFPPSATPTLRQSGQATDHSRRLRTYSSKPGRNPTDDRKEPPKLPRFSLNDLGATPAMKAVIYTTIGIMATVETYTYSLWIYYKLYPQPVIQERPHSENVDV